MRNLRYWVLAVIITLSAVIYQRMIGPTNPKRVKFELSGKEYSTKFTRSMETSITLKEAKGDYNLLSKKTNMKIVIPDSPENMEVFVFYHRYPGNDTIQQTKAIKSGNKYSVQLPAQPPAGKIAFFVEVKDGVNSTTIGLKENIIVRFRNSVPAWALIPHVFLMFFAMLLSNFTGILAFTKSDKVNKYALLVVIMLGLGGLIFGPIVQKYSFGAFWTGWPFGGDLTDNKTLVAFVLWLVALLGIRKKSRLWLCIAAAVIMLLIYSIPHSTAGSEYNYDKGSVVTGVSINTCENRVYQYLRC